MTHVRYDISNQSAKNVATDLPVCRGISEDSTPMPPMLAAMSPTWSASLGGLLCGVIFGAPLTITVLMLVKHRVIRLASTGGRAWLLGFLAGGIVSILCVNLFFTVVWLREFGWAGWGLYWNEFVGGFLCNALFICLPGGLFGAFVCYGSFSDVPAASAAPLPSIPAE